MKWRRRINNSWMNFLKRTIVCVSDGNGYPAVKSESDERGVGVNVATRAVGKAKARDTPKIYIVRN